jgi:outer membrane lipoprotein-sorting protein
MIKASGTAHGLLVTQVVEFYGDENQGEPVQLNETVGYVFPELFRADIKSEHTQRIHIQSGNRTFILIDGEIETDTETRFDLYKDLLLYRSRDLLIKRLSRFGVDVSVSSLGRFEGRLAYIVGAKYPDQTVPQIWVDKQTFLPFRWIITRTVGENQKDALEVRYLKWQKWSDAYYPMQITFYQGGTLVRSINAEDVQTDPVFDDAYFDISYQKSAFQFNKPVDSPPNEEEHQSDVQKTIEDFKKIFE